ncbi:MAG TPA: PHP domain-containing protein, partial [Hyphomicrobiaceae bacterium]|nr:PHP domain-containing protein [Hyphomicrobiaceae bacterium]
MKALIRPRDTAPPTTLAIAAAPKFVHLKVHSAYSLLEGALPIGALARLSKELGFPAVGLTDTNNLFGILEFSEKLAAVGIQPIVGAAVAIGFQEKSLEGSGPGLPQSRIGANHDGLIALYAMDEAGYANLMKLVSRAHLGIADTEGPHIKLADLARYTHGLIVLTGGPDGPIDGALRGNQPAAATARLEALSRLFDNRLYIEIQRHGLNNETDVEPQLLRLAYEHGIPIVASNEAYFAVPQDYEAHDALLCIAESRALVEDDRRRLSREHYFKSAEQMVEVFEDLPEALENTIEIAKRCAFRPRGRKPILPRFVSAGDSASADEQLALEAAELQSQAEEGLKIRLAS